MLSGQDKAEYIQQNSERRSSTTTYTECLKYFRKLYRRPSPKNLFTLFSLFNYMSIINLNIKNRFYDMYNLAEFLTSLHMDVVTESSGDLFNVHVVIQEYWEKQWIEEAKKRTLLKFLAIPKMGKTHYV
jgi:rRNA maturation protein Rpf1